MQKKLLAAVVAVLVLAAAGYFLLNPGGEPAPEAARPVTPPPAAPVAAATPHYPVEVSASALPALDQSDALFGQELAQALGLPALPGEIYPDQMIRRLVATIDNLPRGKVAGKLMPVQPVPGLFKVSGDREMAIAPANALRYRAMLTLAEQADPAKLAQLYQRWYPLFQQAYVELGYPKGYFNDRLVAALDDLLATPEVQEPVALLQPHVLYQYADPELEALSAGQKVMLRMGSGNGARAKKVVQALRAQLLDRSPAH